MGEQSKHQVSDVPYIVWEGERARDERRHRRDFIIILVLIIALLVSNAVWVYEWMQYDYAEEIVTVDGGDRSVVNYIGNNGDISYGEDNSSPQKPN